MPRSRAARPTAPVRRRTASVSRQRRLGRTSPTAVAVALLVSFATSTTTARAATTGSLQAEASAIANKVAAANAELAVIGTEYLTESSNYHHDLTEIAATAKLLSSVRNDIAKRRRFLEGAAVQAYVGEGSSDALGLYLSNRPNRITTTNAYLGIASRDVSSAVAALGNDRDLLTATLSAERRTTAMAAAALAQSSAARAHAIATLKGEQAVLASVRGRLATLVAEQAAAAERAAAARAAAAAAARTAAATSAAAAGPPPPVALSSITTGAAAPTSLSAGFASIRNCESSGDYSLDTGNGYYGAYQFSEQTWLDLGERGLPSQSSPSVQDAAAYRLYQSSGWSSWPECAAIAGLG